MADLIQLSHGIWRPIDSVADLPDRVAALLTRCEPGAVVSEMTAGHLHGLWLPTDCPGPHIEVITHPELPVPSSRSGIRRSAVRGRRRKLHPDEITVFDGIPITTEARTWFDLADRLSLPTWSLRVIQLCVAPPPSLS